MNFVIFWDIEPCDQYANRCFGENYHHHPHGRKLAEEDTRMQQMPRRTDCTALCPWRWENSTAVKSYASGSITRPKLTVAFLRDGRWCIVLTSATPPSTNKLGSPLHAAGTLVHSRVTLCEFQRRRSDHEADGSSFNLFSLANHQSTIAPWRMRYVWTRSTVSHSVSSSSGRCNLAVGWLQCQDVGLVLTQSTLNLW
jgi:hypothetical protein